MYIVNAIREDSRPFFRQFRGAIFGCLLLGVFVGGCSSINDDRKTSEGLGQKTFLLRQVTADRGKAILSDLGLGIIASVADPNTLLVSGSPEELQKVSIVLDLVDANDPYVVETVAAASMARTLPSNQQIARAIGDIAIGTFAAPPDSSADRRGLIDVQGEAVVAIVPANLWPDVRAVVEFGPETLRLRSESDNQSHIASRVSVSLSSTESETEPSQPSPLIAGELETRETPEVEVVAQLTEFGETEPYEPSKSRSHPTAQEDKIVAPAQIDKEPSELESESTVEHEPEERVFRGVLKPSVEHSVPVAVDRQPASVAFPDGDDVLELTLPEKIKLAQLIDLVGEYLHLDCMYDNERIVDQVVTLRLHSKMRSEITVRNLYSLLETVLKFRGLAMTRHDGNLVTIVPAADVLNSDPELVDLHRKTLQVGDMVVTRLFELRHVDVSSVTNLLQNMKLGVAVSAIEENQTLFVTCYAHRMARIERLVSMVDRPGRPKEFRFRRLEYTVAKPIAQKVLALAKELQDIPITIAPTATSEASSRSSRRAKDSGAPTSAPLAGDTTVYMDTDERTNRILMIGGQEQLETVENLIDILDVPQDDLPVLKVYEIVHVAAHDIVQKLGQLEVAPAGKRAAKTSKTSKTSAPTGTSGGDPKIVLLEATNSLLINATRQQHDQIQTIIGYIDVLLTDFRSLQVYEIQHANADEVVEKLQELGFMGRATPSTGGSAKISAAPPARGASLAEGPQMVILEATNSLLLYATDEQHHRLRNVIPYLDIEISRERIPYEIHFLENQDPEHMAEVLGRLVQETITNKEGKIEQIIKKTDEEIIIIPDTGTFSLIVYANRKNQEWIADLVKQLDKRRPQVLIDVTLVEINKTEAFTYDLNLIQSFPDLTATSGLTGAIAPSVSSSDIMDRLATSGRNQFADYQSNGGDFTGFYGDKHINLLLSAMQSKNYGRVLAKPKILVNDNQPGSIKTTDTTYVTKRSSIPVSSGGAGNDATLIETAVDYQSYEAGITLNITPHISQGELLRLDIELVRSDFRETDDPEKPPDTTASEIKTTVFVPDGSTIILGGLLKLNQNKGGTKVPILGDIPLIGGLFRSINNKDMQNKLYVFVKAEIIRPGNVFTQGMAELDAISEKNRHAFEEHEQEFQDYQNWPGIKPKPVEPKSVLEAQ